MKKIIGLISIMALVLLSGCALNGYEMDVNIVNCDTYKGEKICDKFVYNCHIDNSIPIYQMQEEYDCRQRALSNSIYKNICDYYKNDMNNISERLYYKEG